MTPPSTSMRPRGASPAVVLLSLLPAIAISAIVWHRLLSTYAPPFEDAAMLLRYARHWAEGDGIVWNRGEAPVDGATDFGFLAAVTAFVRCGLDPLSAARWLGIGAHLVTIGLVYRVALASGRAGPWVAGLCAAFVAGGPGLLYVQAGFGTPFFAVFALAAWIACNAVATGGGNARAAHWFAGLSFATGLVRPEGVILCGFMAASLIPLRGWRRAWPALRIYLAVNLCLGLLYLGWRQWTFGHLLPNPFLKKGGGHLYPESLLLSISLLREMIGPLLAVALAAAAARHAPRKTVALAVVVAGFTSIWVLLSNEMNYRGRFQYAVVPIVAASWPALVRWRSMRFGSARSRWIGTAALAAAVLGAAYVLVSETRQTNKRLPTRDGLQAIGEALHPFAARGRRMAVTEAGVLPYLSDWTALDTWGLNDPSIARAGMLTQERLSEFAPDLLMENVFPDGSPDEPWNRMTTTLETWAREHDFVLVAEYGEHGSNLHRYFVRRALVDFDEIAGVIRATPYSWADADRVVGNRTR